MAADESTTTIDLDAELAGVDTKATDDDDDDVADPFADLGEISLGDLDVAKPDDGDEA